MAAALVAVAFASGCGEESEGSSDAELTAVATTTHVADLVANVGGERVEVHRILDPGADPHEYEPRPSDAEAVVDAGVVFRSGGAVDEWLADVLENAGGDADVVTLLDEVEARTQGRLDAGGGGEPDPHWWQDPGDALLAVDAIAEALARADPEAARRYRRNADLYSREIERLDEQIARCFRSVPAEERKLVTTHDAYGEFAERYGIEVVGALIPSRSTQAQPSAGETAELVEQIEDEGARAIFPESALDPKLEQAVADEAGAVVGDPLWADSLGDEGSDGATYLKALASDAEAMVEGFTGGERSCRLRR